MRLISNLQKSVAARPHLWTVFAGLATLSLVFRPALLLLWLVFPFAGAVEVNRKNFLLAIPWILFGNVCLLVLAGAGLSVLGVPFGLNSLWILAVLIGMIFLSSLQIKSAASIEAKHKTIRELGIILVIYFLFGLAIVARLISVANAPVPILHDPVAHAIWTNSLLQQGTIHFFYSPGLHIISGFTSLAGGIDPARAVHLSSNFFNALSVLSWGVCAYIATKRKSYAVSAAALIFLVPVPAALYYTSGKNALVMALAFLPMVFVLAQRRTRTLAEGTLLAGALVALGLIHYPTFGFVAAGVAMITIVELLSEKNRRTKLAEWVNVGLPIAIAVAVIGVWIVLHPETIDKIPGRTVESARSLAAIKMAVGQTYAEFAGFMKSFPGYKRIDFMFMPLAILSGAMAFGRRWQKESFAAVVFTAAIIGIPLLINVLGIPGAGIIRSSGVLLSFVALVLLVAFAISDIATSLRWSTGRAWLLGGIAVVLVLLSAKQQYSYFADKTSALQTVDESDLSAFEWVKEHTNQDDGFIINAAISPKRGNIVYASDGGVWLPVFTDRRVSAPFDEFASPQTHANFKLYTNLQGRSDPKALCTFYRQGYRYYYQDTGVFGPSFDVAGSKNFREVFSNGSVKLFALQAANCQ